MVGPDPDTDLERRREELPRVAEDEEPDDVEGDVGQLALVAPVDLGAVARGGRTSKQRRRRRRRKTRTETASQTLRFTMPDGTFKLRSSTN